MATSLKSGESTAASRQSAACRTELVGESASFRRAVALADEIAETGLPVLILGETGTGKELIAQRIHQRSARKAPLIDLNCAALPAEMLESLLFGHRKGAFTGAVSDGQGLIAAADGGSLLLDELSALALPAQAKLLRVLETREVRRLGDVVGRRVDFRLICAAQDDLPEQVATNRFRADLFYRLATVTINLPPLRARPADIPALAAHFATALRVTLEPLAVDVLCHHNWPGNVRELRAVIERAAVAHGAGSIVPPSSVIAALTVFRKLGQATDRSEPGQRTATAAAVELERLCREHAWNATHIAAALGIHRVTLFRRLKRAGLSLRRGSTR